MSASHSEPHGHGPGAKTSSLALLLAMLLTLCYAAVEAAVGWWSGSLALLGDAGHMLTDAVALLIAVLAARIARMPPSPRHSFGMARAQLVAALVNAAFMLAVVGMLSVEAVARLINPVDVNGEAVTVVAGAGLLLNMAVAWMLSRGTPDLNVRAALLHVMGDLLGSVAAIASGVLVHAHGLDSRRSGAHFRDRGVDRILEPAPRAGGAPRPDGRRPLSPVAGDDRKGDGSGPRRGLGARPAHLVDLGRTNCAFRARGAGPDGAMGCSARRPADPARASVSKSSTSPFSPSPLPMSCGRWREVRNLPTQTRGLAGPTMGAKVEASLQRQPMRKS